MERIQFAHEIAPIKASDQTYHPLNSRLQTPGHTNKSEPHFSPSLIVAMRFPFPEKTQNFGAAENRTCKCWWLRLGTQASTRKGRVRREQ
jgi:hypothetical protein